MVTSFIFRESILLRNKRRRCNDTKSWTWTIDWGVKRWFLFFPTNSVPNATTITFQKFNYPKPCSSELSNGRVAIKPVVCLQSGFFDKHLCYRTGFFLNIRIHIHISFFSFSKCFHLLAKQCWNNHNSTFLGRSDKSNYKPSATDIPCAISVSASDSKIGTHRLRWSSGMHRTRRYVQYYFSPTTNFPAMSLNKNLSRKFRGAKYRNSSQPHRFETCDEYLYNV